MRRYLVQLGSVLILLVCLGSHVSEIFDSWDHTLQTGNDIESTMVVLALVVGVALVVAHLALRTTRTIVAEDLQFFPADISEPALSLDTCLGHSPPSALRI